MRAWELYGPNDIRFENMDIPAPGKDEVQIKVRAAGICGSDVPRVFVTGAHSSPLVPGHEFSGEVVKVGAVENGGPAASAYKNSDPAAAGVSENGCPESPEAAWNGVSKAECAPENGATSSDMKIAAKASTSVVNGAAVTISEKSMADPDNLIGKRVAVFPLIPCKKCPSCREKRYEMCQNYDYLGSRSDGGFAEYVNVPVWNLIGLPDNVSYETGAMLEPLAVSVHAIRQVMPWIGRKEAAKGKPVSATDAYGKEADSEKEKIIVIMGLGTIGRLLFYVLLSEGFKNIFVIGNKTSQKKAVIDAGLDEDRYIDASQKGSGSSGEYAIILEEVMLRTGGHGADYFFECIGKNESVSMALDLTAAAGKIVLVGNPASDMTLTRETYWKILRHQMEIHGTWNSSFTGEEDDDWHYAMKLLGEGKPDIGKMITHRIALSELDKGLAIMRDKSEEYTKIMVSDT